MSMLHGGFLGLLLGEAPSTQYDVEAAQKQATKELLGGMIQPQQSVFQSMANQRISCGFEPIDWPRIIVNLFRAEALTRPMTICEKLLYDGAVQALRDAQNETKD